MRIVASDYSIDIPYYRMCLKSANGRIYAHPWNKEQPRYILGYGYSQDGKTFEMKKLHEAYECGDEIYTLLGGEKASELAREEKALLFEELTEKLKLHLDKTEGDDESHSEML